MNVRLQIYWGGGEGGEGSGTWYLVEPTQKTVSLTNIFLSKNDC